MVRRPSRRAVIGQWFLLAGVVACGWLLVSEVAENLARKNLHFGFGFLWQQAHFDIPFHLVSWSIYDLYARTLLIGLLNTMLVAAIAIVLATTLGVTIGVMRLSVNWLVKNIALCFIEFVRNTPQLVQIVFWYVGVLQTLPQIRQSIHIPGGALLNNRGLFLPDWDMTEVGYWMAWAALALLLVTPFAWRIPLGKAGVVGLKVLVLPFLALGLFLAGIEKVTYPELQGFNLAGGTQVPPELVALAVGLSIYASAFIAEIVRGAIQAIPKGQHEAAAAMGFRAGPRLFLIILPQALRIMIPQMTSQYLNIIKGTSLGAAIAYPELFAIFTGTVMNQANKEIETILIVVAIFVTINLLTSAFMNWYNRRIMLVER